MVSEDNGSDAEGIANFIIICLLCAYKTFVCLCLCMCARVRARACIDMCARSLKKKSRKVIEINKSLAHLHHEQTITLMTLSNTKERKVTNY